MIPTFDRVDTTEIPKTSACERRTLRIKRTLGKFLFDLFESQRKAEEVYRYHHTQNLRSGGDRLSREQLRRLREHQDGTMDLEFRKQYFTSSDHSRTLHGIVVPLLEKILMKDPSVKRTLNIGCNYAYMDFVLSKRFPDVTFQGVDVNPKLVELNADLRSRNLAVFPGYALEMLEAGELSADLVYFSSTATAIRAKELQAYVNVLAKNAKYVVFSEPLWAGPWGERINPAELPAGDSTPIYMQRHPDTEAIGYLCYIHNYRGMLEAAGFEVFSYNAYRPDFASLDWVLAAGQNRNGALWELK